MVEIHDVPKKMRVNVNATCLNPPSLAQSASNDMSFTAVVLIVCVKSFIYHPLFLPSNVQCYFMKT